MVCGALMLVAFSPALAQSNSPQSVRLTNRDVLELADGERQYWIHGAVSSAAATLMNKDDPTGQCIWDWFSVNSDEAYSMINGAFQRYPDSRPNSTVLAVLDTKCPDLLK